MSSFRNTHTTRQSYRKPIRLGSNAKAIEKIGAFGQHSLQLAKLQTVCVVQATEPKNARLLKSYQGRQRGSLSSVRKLAKSRKDISGRKGEGETRSETSSGH